MNIFHKFLHKHKFIYKLSPEEKILFNKLVNNVLIQLVTDENKRKHYYIILDKDENDLLDKIHAHFYGANYYISDPISVKQVNYVWFNDIINKLIF